MEGLQQIDQVDTSEHLKYLEPSKEEIFRARCQIQLMLMARLFKLDINDDPDPEKNALIDEEWMKDYSKEYADLLKDNPDLLFKYIHGNQDDVVEELFKLLKEKHEVHA